MPFLEGSGEVCPTLSNSTLLTQNGNLAMTKIYSPYRLAVSIITLFLLLPETYAYAHTVTGYVDDQHHQPIPGTQVYIASLDRGTVTNAKGYFKIKDLPKGMYAVQFSYVGYLTQVKHINSNRQTSLKIVLKQSILQMQGLTVTGTPEATDALSSSQSISSVSSKQFQINSGVTAMSAIKNIPGVTLMTTGNDIAKPVIHGLSSQRLVVMVDGVRQESQNWGPDHGPEISPFQVNRMEVVKGPSSVLYGAGAIGGVVNVIGPKLPVSGDGAPKLGGKAYLQGFSNDSQGAGAISLHGASGSVGYRALISHRSAGDMQTPGGLIYNSGLHRTYGSFMVGTTKQWGTVSLDFEHLYEHLQIHDVPGSTGYSPLQNNLLHLHASIPTKDFRLEVQAGYQTNDRKEYDNATQTPPSVHLKLHTGTVNILAHENPIGPVYGTVGVSTMIQSNRTIGTSKLIPAYNLQNYAAFIYEQAKFGILNLSAGGRFDTRNLGVLSTPALNVKSVDKKYHAFSGAFGAALHITSNLAFSANIGHAWRAPQAFEMFAQFAHIGTYQYDVGNPNLGPELSTNVQTSLKWITSRVIGKITIYNNAINHYIYGDPTNKFDPASGYRIYDMKQANARLQGLDASLQTQVTRWLSLDGAFSMVKGENLKLHVPLPYIPANHGYLGFRMESRKLGSLEAPFFSLHTVFYAKQDRVAPHEPVSKAYTLVNFSLGSNIHIAGTPVEWNLVVTNLFNKAYISHLNRYRNLPSSAIRLNPGRDVVLKIQIPFNVM